ncbi:hypothetical protein GOQ27_07885 [Clostridium sp. D2Q-11]|uniref:DUF3953 domain-containing protein n=1 Tax=Anaeromonas frigoriresistens TaxID=2683708 RepID=A0A942UXZ2_9FIRM|nr:hypothetical protein [Anaeromonas frigoriresistens]MBS4538381.1 hypothetical protein [Anaeromonas frigoriresistens]
MNIITISKVSLIILIMLTVVLFISINKGIEIYKIPLTNILMTIMFIIGAIGLLNTNENNKIGAKILFIVASFNIVFIIFIYII